MNCAIVFISKAKREIALYLKINKNKNKIRIRNVIFHVDN